MLRIKYTSHTTNIDVGAVGPTTDNLCKGNDYGKQPEKQTNVGPYYAGHLMRNTSGRYDTLPRTIEGRLQGKR